MSDTAYQTTGDNETDALFGTSDEQMAVRFGARAKLLIRDGRDPKGAARLAFSYADRILQRTMSQDDIEATLAARAVKQLVAGWWQRGTIH